MLDDAAFIAYCERLNLPENGRQILESIRSSNPARHVGGGKQNTPVILQSRKMRLSIHTESRTVEYAGARIFYEAPDEVLEYWDQPKQIFRRYPVKNGKILPVRHTPDFLVLYVDRACFEEWKTEEELLRLSKANHYLYVRDETGRWRCPPGEEYAAQFGLGYTVRSSAEINPDYLRNIFYIKDYLRSDCPPVPDSIQSLICDRVKASPGITFTELRDNKEGITADYINTLIAHDVLYVDWNAVPLSDQERVRIFIDAETALAYATMIVPTDEYVHLSISLASGGFVSWDGKTWEILNLGETTVALLSQDESKTLINLPIQRFEALLLSGEITLIDSNTTEEDARIAESIKRLNEADREEREAANRRYNEVKRKRDGLPPLDPNLSLSTLRSWVRKARLGEAMFGSGFVGLLDNYGNCGNRNDRFSPELHDLIDKYIKEYETTKQKSIYAVWDQLVKACEAKGLLAPSYKSFRKLVKMRPVFEQTLNRKGSKAAYKFARFYLEYTTPRHGERPFETAHIDHTETDIELIDPSTGEVIGRAWLTVMLDAYSRRVLAFVLTFDEPSYRSCMLVLRECVRRHGRLPDTVVVDGGKEFQSEYFETFLARYEIDKIERKGKPRKGSLIERFFGTSNSLVFHLLEGNTQSTKNVREMTESVNPKNLASWTLARLHRKFAEFAYEKYDTKPHGTLKDTPRNVFNRALYRTGRRPNRVTKYTEHFIRDTLPTTPKGTAKVELNLGVKINYIYYWHDSMRNSEVVGTQVQVKYDPFDIGVAYVYIKLKEEKRGEWKKCLSQYHYMFRGMTERQLSIVTAILRKRNKDFGRTITSKQMVDFLNSAEAEEALHAQRIKDENRKSIDDMSVDEGSLTPELAVPGGAAPTLPAPTDVPLIPSGSDAAEIIDEDDNDDADDLTLYEGFKL